MNKLYLAIILMIISQHVFCQAEISKDSTAADSVNAVSLLRSSSYMQVGFGIGNELYSVHNHVLNAKQVTPPMVFTPTVSYFHKSGFSISASSYLLTENNSFGANQYAVSPMYENAPDSTFDLLVSYTHYFINNEYSMYSSPIQNDLYSSLVYKKTWLQPGFALGYSAGISKDVIPVDTTVNGTKKQLYDSMTNSLKLFTTVLSVQHSFEWLGILGNTDSAAFTPVLMLNLGSSNTNVANEDNLNAALGGNLTKAQLTAERTKLRQKIKRYTKLQNMAYGIESIGTDLQASYYFGEFSIEPDIYLDYYLPKTNQKRFTQAFVVNFSYTF